jgi:hypothetical protein
MRPSCVAQPVVRPTPRSDARVVPFAADTASIIDTGQYSSKVQSPDYLATQERCHSPKSILPGAVGYSRRTPSHSCAAFPVLTYTIVLLLNSHRQKPFSKSIQGREFSPAMGFVSKPNRWRGFGQCCFIDHPPDLFRNLEEG